MVDRVTQPLVIITLCKVFARMCTTALFSRLGNNSGRLGGFKQILQFETFNPSRIERVALVFELHICDAVFEVIELLNAFLHKLAVSEYAEVVLHHTL